MTEQQAPQQAPVSGTLTLANGTANGARMADRSTSSMSTSASSGPFVRQHSAYNSNSTAANSLPVPSPTADFFAAATAIDPKLYNYPHLESTPDCANGLFSASCLINDTFPMVCALSTVQGEAPDLWLQAVISNSRPSACPQQASVTAGSTHLFHPFPAAPQNLLSCAVSLSEIVRPSQPSVQCYA